MFLDELPEFQRSTLDALRQPLETGYVSISRVSCHTQYPANFQLVAAMNPCRCGYFGIGERQCSRSPKCVQEYQAKISGPLLDRFDIHIQVPPISPWDMTETKKGESSTVIRQRVITARNIQQERFNNLGYPSLHTNSQLKGELLEEVTKLENDAKELLISFANKTSKIMVKKNRGLR